MIDRFRQLAAKEITIAEKAPPGPWNVDDSGDVLGPGPEDEYYGRLMLQACGSMYTPAVSELAARSRMSVPLLCDAIDVLLAVVENLPRCEGTAGCSRPAVREYTPPGHRELLCDHHDPIDPLFVKYPSRSKHINDLSYANALRALEGKK